MRWNGDWYSIIYNNIIFYRREEMTYKKLKEIIEKNNIPENVKLQSDSGWECDPTDMDGIFYNTSENKIIFTQGWEPNDKYYNEPYFIMLFHKEQKK
jgi:hypothetical protein